MGIEKKLNAILDRIALAADSCGRKREEITLVAVSKGRTLEEIREAYALGIRDFGESRVADALAKMEALSSDIRWHFIGKLQKNKVNKAVGKFALIHSVDTFELAMKIATSSLEIGKTSRILLEVNTSGEPSKSGLTPKEWEHHYPALTQLKGIEIEGLMTMAPLTEDERLIRTCFSDLRFLGEKLGVQVLSMGMTNDFLLAIQEGATHVRIGTALFEK